MRMHDVPGIVDDLLSKLAAEKRPEIRNLLLATLCRLRQREGEWTGDSWGTRPDTRGPYYQPVKWAETDKILAALKSTLDAAHTGGGSFLVKEMSRNRIQSNDALSRIPRCGGRTIRPSSLKPSPSSSRPSPFPPRACRS